MNKLLNAVPSVMMLTFVAVALWWVGLPGAAAIGLFFCGLYYYVHNIAGKPSKKQAEAYYDEWLVQIELFKSEYGYKYKPWPLFEDDYVLGYVFGHAVPLITYQLGNKKFNLIEYESNISNILETISGKPSAQLLMKRIEYLGESKSEPSFEIGLERGNKTAEIFLGKTTFDNDPDVIEARQAIPLTRKVYKSVGESAGTDAKVICSLLHTNYFSNYIRKNCSKSS